MNTLKMRMKKGIVIALAAAMACSLAPSLPGSVTEAKAADSALSKTAYADKEQLKTGDNTGSMTIKFGKNEKGEVASWYVLGSNASVTEDNTALMATDALKKSVQFNTTGSETSYDKNANYEWVDSKIPSTIQPSIYGQSNLRKVLNQIAVDTSYFSTEEQKIMVPWQATMNRQVPDGYSYYITDKLVEVSWVYGGNALQVPGTGQTLNTVSLGRSCNAWIIERYYEDSTTYVLDTGGGSAVAASVTKKCGALPGATLNLTNVLFASAATPASSDAAVHGTIAADTAMTLKLDGSSMDIGNAVYIKDSGVIAATKGNIGLVVALVVQGNDGTNDWYYSKQIDGSEQVMASDIKTAAGLAADPDLSACRIWLETTSDGMSYAVQAQEGKTPTPAGYEILEGADSTWKEDSGADLVIRGSGELAEFKEVKVDGAVLAAENYTTASGSTIVTLKNAYLKTLSNGTHPIEIVWNGGTAATNFTVSKTASGGGGSTGGGETGGNNNTWTKDSDTDMVVTPDKKVTDVTEVKVDGNTLEKDKDYTVDSEGNVTIKKDYLDKLLEGDHKIDIVGKDGTTASAIATVKPKENGNAGGNNNNGGSSNNSGNNNNSGSSNNSNNNSAAGNNGNTAGTAGTTTNVTSGADSTWTKDKNADLVIGVDKKISDITEVKVDGKVLDPSAYTVGADGSVTIRQDYLKTLGAGEHKVEINGKEGTASTTFKVADAAQTTAPKTGDSASPLIWTLALLAALAGLGGMYVRVRKYGQRRHYR